MKIPKSIFLVRAINKVKQKFLFLKILPVVFLLFMNFPFVATAQERDIYQRLDTPYYDLSDTLSGCATAALNGALSSEVPEPYNSLFTQAAAAFRMNPQFLAAIFLTENGNVWKPFDTKWATSPAGASGPFQFMPATWATYQTDGNGDGVKDINNMYDAAYSAANLLATYVSLNAPLGSLNAPYKPNTLLEAAAAYNWGPGNVQMHTTPSSPITGDGSVPTETQEYVSNVYSLITSGFTKSGKPSYPDPSPGSNTTASATTSQSCVCTASAGSSSNATVVLDPGHGPNFSQIDAATGLNMVESHNVPEINEVWDVAQKVKTQLESAGYKVILTKNDVDGAGITFRDRANVANNSNAAIAVSIHDDHGQSYSNFKEIYDQEVGAYRGSGANKTTFTDSAVADKSKQYSQIFKQERQKAEGGSPVVKLNSFDGRPGLEPGNIPMVQLFSKVPWVYNEVGASGNLNDTQKTQYAEGIVNGVKAAIPINGNTGGCPGGSGVVAGNIAQTAINFSWPEDRGSIPKPEYAAAVQKYNPGSSCSGADCGVFVATVMIASGADTNYPKSGTSAQEAYVRSSGKYDVVDKVNDTSELQPGDILIVNTGSGAGAAGHTYIYVGQQPGGKNAAAASWSSDCSNASMPRLTMAALSDSRGNYLRARIK